eukprot:CAMPEP_0113868862 /NCGR_PEP_ID=MMETSP0780_2-20120614/1224_1 /TAXON_ID=652834 /ORGANISM="Palpitomonas bilix" /LENGTH=307 /DNA_ID=CAMNT_0000853991 /DNA_START=235 /DNA_END=1155 /DNA_ORIENTATION=- /assembly_acc=CAM_ASM_000599
MTSTILTFILLSSVCFLGSAYTLSIYLARLYFRGQYPFDWRWVALLTEFSKLIVCAVLDFCSYFRYEYASPRIFIFSFLKFGVSSFAYVIDTGIAFIALEFISPSLFQVVGGFRICTSVLLAKSMLGREPTLRSFLVCAAVVAGIALCELDKMLQEDRTVLRDVAGSSQITTLIGSLLGVLFCFISSVADTYNEKLLKTDPCEPLYLQNAKLYTWGVIFNGALLLLPSLPRLDIVDPNVETKFVDCGTPSAVAFMSMITIVGACNGLLISLLLKKVDAVGRQLAGAMSIVVSTVGVSLIDGNVPSAW